jgi:hypothetical protein
MLDKYVPSSSKNNIIKFILLGPLDRDTLYPMTDIMNVSLITVPRTAALSHRQPTIAGIFLDICGAQDSDKKKHCAI